MPEQAFDDLLEWYRWEFGVPEPGILDWTGDMRVRPRITDDPVRDERPNAPARNTVVFGPADDHLRHADASLHLVVLAEGAAEARFPEAEQVARDAVLVLAPDGNARATWLRHHGAPATEVTVLVPTTGAPGLAACLQAVLATTPATPAIEVVVVDAGTTGAAAAVAAAQTRHVRLVRADPRRGTIGALNPGAEAARGDLLVVVGESTRVLPGWLRPLVRPLRDDPRVGLVGGRLLPDAQVSHAGGAGAGVGHAGGRQFPDASTAAAARIGRDGVRESRWGSASLMATRRGLLRRLGGIDPLVGPAYGDVDLGRRMQAAGRRVLHQPQALAYADPDSHPNSDPDSHPNSDPDSHPNSDPDSDPPPWFVRRWAGTPVSLPARPRQEQTGG